MDREKEELLRVKAQLTKLQWSLDKQEAKKKTLDRKNKRSNKKWERAVG